MIKEIFIDVVARLRGGEELISSVRSPICLRLTETCSRHAPLPGKELGALVAPSLPEVFEP